MVVFVKEVIIVRRVLDFMFCYLDVGKYWFMEIGLVLIVL